MCYYDSTNMSVDYSGNYTYLGHYCITCQRFVLDSHRSKNYYHDVERRMCEL